MTEFAWRLPLKASVFAVAALLTGCTGVNEGALSAYRRNTSPGLVEFLRQFDPQGSDKDNHGPVYYSAIDVPLRGADPKVETLVYVSEPEICGTGGCALWVLDRTQTGYKENTYITVVQKPVRVLTTWSHGRPDLAVWVQGGGIQPGYEAVLKFNGRAYPNNPTVGGAPSDNLAAGGRTLFPEDSFRRLDVPAHLPRK